MYFLTYFNDSIKKTVSKCGLFLADLKYRSLRETTTVYCFLAIASKITIGLITNSTRIHVSDLMKVRSFLFICVI